MAVARQLEAVKAEVLKYKDDPAVIIWAIGFLGYHAGGIIHILLVIALIAFLLRVIRSA